MKDFLSKLKSKKNLSFDESKSVFEISKIRDEYLLNLQKMRKKYENKIRK